MGKQNPQNLSPSLMFLWGENKTWGPGIRFSRKGPVFTQLQQIQVVNFNKSLLRWLGILDSFCWWLKSHSQPPEMVLKPLVNNGISTTNLNWLAGLLNHQRFHLQNFQKSVSRWIPARPPVKTGENPFINWTKLGLNLRVIQKPQDLKH